MGYYIPGPTTGKVSYLLEKFPEVFTEIDLAEATEIGGENEEFGIVVVVGNHYSFEAAGFAFGAREFLVFTDRGDLRYKKYLKGPRDVVEKMSGFPEKGDPDYDRIRSHQLEKPEDGVY